MAVAVMGSGCTGRCTYDNDCGSESYCNPDIGRCATQCFANVDCHTPPACESSESGCEPLGTVCRDGRCAGNPYVGGGDSKIGEDDDGWTDAAFTGPVFVVSALQMGEARIGFDLEGSQGVGTDNALASIADYANPPVQQGLQGGVTILLFEIAGLLPNYVDEDWAVTLKVYVGTDADANPNNNFNSPLPGEPCCQFRADPASLSGGSERQALTRARARIVGGVLRSIDPFTVDLQLNLGSAQPSRLLFDHTKIQFKVPDDLETLEDGVMGGAIPMATLGGIPDPYCRQGGMGCPGVADDGTLLDLVSALIGNPDVDLDDDGPECLYDSDGDQRIDLCCQGKDVAQQCIRGNMCAATPIVSFDPMSPAQCIHRDQMADGYSVGLTLEGVRAIIQ